jgi:nitric-oxide synthase
VAIEHPELPGMADLGLRWCTVPTTSNFRLSLGGVDYCACPFNGWFMELEVCRNLFDRYEAGPRWRP